MRGIILAGGTGSRLWPLTRAMSKQLLPVFDKPMIYYALSTLLRAEITEILIITTPGDRRLFEDLLGTGERFGASFEYLTQERPEGIAQALIIGEKFIRDEPVTLILGDNIFHADLNLDNAPDCAKIFGYEVQRPQDYGVIGFDDEGFPVELVEKPTTGSYRYAIPGLYVYPPGASWAARQLRPSARGELEITDLHREYLHYNLLDVELMPRGAAWLDAGTFDGLFAASEYVRALQERQGILIGSPEESAWKTGLISNDGLRNLANSYPNAYGHQLLNLLGES